MKFPLVRGDKNHFPRKAVCPQCKKRKVFEPHSMVILGGGALLMDRNRENSIHSDSLEGFLSLAWHGAHDNGVGEDRDIDGRVHLAKDVRGGQFDLYFCSTACVRVFFNSWVDALEKAIVCEKKRPPDSPKKLKRFLTDMRKRGLLEE